MVRKIKEKGITDEAVLNAILNIPRHFFFDDIFVEHAYQDKAFPIAEGQTISQPYTVASQTELLGLKPGEKVLEIGTGSGYQCCVLLELGVEVVTIEYIERLSLRAQKMLKAMKYAPKFVIGDGTVGYSKESPYDGILVTAGAPHVPKSLLKQLKVGGRLVIPVGDRKTQKMVRITKTSEKETLKEEFSNFSFVPLVGEKGWK